MSVSTAQEDFTNSCTIPYLSWAETLHDGRDACQKIIYRLLSFHPPSLTQECLNALARLPNKPGLTQPHYHKWVLVAAVDAAAQ